MNQKVNINKYIFESNISNYLTKNRFPYLKNYIYFNDKTEFIPDQYIFF